MTRTDPEDRVRAALHTLARAMPVDPPPLREVLAPRARPRRRPALALAAAVVLVAAVIGVARWRSDGDRPPVQAGGEPPHVVWPLGDGTPSGAQGAPETIAEAYARDELGLGDEWARDRAEDDAGESPKAVKVRFTRRGDRPGRYVDVNVVEIGRRWYVIGSGTEASPVVTEARVAGQGVVVEAVPSGLRRPARRATAQVVGADGAVLATLEADLTGGAWRFGARLQPGTAPPAAVRVVAGADRADATAVIVLPAAVADSPVRPLFPAVAPVSSYEDAWRYTLTHPDDPRRDWRWALTATITAVSNGAGQPAPRYDHVVTRPGGLAMNGRYTTGDGSRGTFELARLRPDGPWFLLSLKDDAITVGPVTTTPTEARVPWEVGVDYRLAAAKTCGGAAGQPVDQAWGHAGVRLLCRFPMHPAGAGYPTADAMQVVETTGDHRLLRYYDAWSP